MGWMDKIQRLTFLAGSGSVDLPLWEKRSAEDFLTWVSSSSSTAF